MALYFIDYENVSEGGLEGVKRLTFEDKVIVFYGQNARTIPFERMIELTSCGAGLEFIKSNRIAKNYLDFQLTSYLGYLIGTGYQGKVYIISKDTGFDSVVDFWKNRNVTVIRQEKVSVERNQKKEQKKKKAQNNGTQNNNSQNNSNNQNNGNNQKNNKKKQKQKASAAEELAAGLTVPEEPVMNLPQTEEGPFTDLHFEAETAASETAASETAASETAAAEKSSAEDMTSEAMTSENQPEPEAIISEFTKAVSEPREKQPLAEVVKPSEPEKQKGNRKAPSLPEAYRKKVRAAVKNEQLASTNYTRIYRIFEKIDTVDQLKQNLLKQFGQDKGNILAEKLSTIFESYRADR